MTGSNSLEHGNLSQSISCIICLQIDESTFDHGSQFRRQVMIKFFFASFCLLLFRLLFINCPGIGLLTSRIVLAVITTVWLTHSTYLTTISTFPSVINCVDPLVSSITHHQKADHSTFFMLSCGNLLEQKLSI